VRGGGRLRDFREQTDVARDSIANLPTHHTLPGANPFGLNPLSRERLLFCVGISFRADGKAFALAITVGSAMTQIEHPELRQESEFKGPAIRAAKSRGGLKFGRNNDFQVEVRHRVDEFFKSTGRRRRDVPQMYVKTFILLAAFAALYYLLVFVAQTWWQAMPLAILLGLTTAGIGFNIQHDGGHQAYSEQAGVNKLMALSLDLIGGSSYLWHYKHGVFHHTYVNITHEDTDIDLGMLARVTPHQKRYWFHRWQHLYIWALYGLFVIKWHLFDDFRDVITGRVGEHRVPRPKGWDLVAFIAGKVIFLTLAIGIPLLFHRLWVVFVFYGVVAAVLGSVLSVVFQLAHAVEAAEFPMPIEDTGNMEHAWAIHQVETTVGLRPPQPGRGVAVGRLELPDRAPPAAPHLPHQFPRPLADRRRHLPRVRDQVQRAPLVPRRRGLTPPLAAADGPIRTQAITRVFRSVGRCASRSAARPFNIPMAFTRSAVRRSCQPCWITTLPSASASC
jgi:linoleoyl-CoA desaturase